MESRTVLEKDQEYPAGEILCRIGASCAFESNNNWMKT